MSARIALGGYSAASFGATQQAAFAAALASQLGVAAADVAVTGVMDYMARRRALLAASAAVEVSFTVAAKDDAAANTLKAGISAAASDAGAPALLATLQGAGLGAVSSVQLTAPPTAASTSSAGRSSGGGVKALLVGIAAALVCV